SLRSHSMIGRTAAILATWLMAMAMAGTLPGCAAGSTSLKADSARAECPVCRENADLACLMVRITDSTPRVEYQGRTYYFCSEECRAAFEKQPAKYAGR